MTSPPGRAQAASAEQTSQPLGHFLLLGTDEPGVLPIPAGSVTVGRDDSCDLVLRGVAVSRRHCRLDFEPSGWHRVVDLGSTTGLWINGVSVEAADLQPYDRMRVGEYELLYLDSRTKPDDVVRVLAPHPESDLPSLRPPEQVRRSLRERLTWLTLMFQELRSEDELAPLLDALVDELFRKPACVCRIVVVLFDERTASGLRTVKLRDAPADHVRAEALAPYVPLVRRALEEDQVLVQKTPLGPATVCVPMRSHRRTPGTERRRYQPGNTRGALLMSSPGLSLNAEEKQLFQILARQVAVLLSSVDMQRRATIDSLTTLINRSHTEQILRDELSQSASTGTPLSVLLIDLDDFKRINDTHGHEAGDQVLREVALRLRCTLRLADSAGRWGGEEFLAVLPGTDTFGAALAAEKLMHELRATPMGSHGLSVTASVGVACYPGDAREADSLLLAADQALYHAKESGKNQLAVFDPEGGQRSLERTQRYQLKRRPRRAPLAWLVCDACEPAPLRVGYTSVGRDPASDICLPGAGVSRRHGVLKVTPRGEVTYQDCSDADGVTAHNGAPVEMSVCLALGDRLKVGPHELVLTDQPVAHADLAGSSWR